MIATLHQLSNGLSVRGLSRSVQHKSYNSWCEPLRVQSWAISLVMVTLCKLSIGRGRRTIVVTKWRRLIVQIFHTPVFRR